MSINSRQCPVCILYHTDEITSEHQDKYREIDCNRCGKFRISNQAYEKIIDFSMLEQKDKRRALLSYRIRRSSENKIWDEDAINSVFKNDSLPSIHQQIENLIVYIGDRQKSAGDQVTVVWGASCAKIGSVDEKDLLFLASSLADDCFIKVIKETSYSGTYTLTIQGWNEYERIRMGHTDSKLAFMAMPFGDAELDMLFNETWKPAALQAGFILERIDERPKTGSIMNRMRNEIRKAKFVVAELTKSNPGAYWEAGFAEGLGKPVLYMCEKEQFKTTKTHFDVNQQTTVIWDRMNLNEAANQLKLIIRNTLPHNATLSDD